LRQAKVLTWIQPAQEHLNRAVALLQHAYCAEAIAECDKALELIPKGHAARADAQACRAMALVRLGEHARAMADYDEAIRANPAFAPYYINRGICHVRQRNYAAAQEDYRRAVSLDPKQVTALNNLAWLWATCPDPDFRNGAQAIECATRACTLAGWKEPNCLGTLAAACAEAGDFTAAITWQQKALEHQAYVQQHGDQARRRIQLYTAGTPCRDEGGV
jgi:serine/threonine-protein kinase